MPYVIIKKRFSEPCLTLIAQKTKNVDVISDEKMREK